MIKKKRQPVGLQWDIAHLRWRRCAFEKAGRQMGCKTLMVRHCHCSAGDKRAEQWGVGGKQVVQSWRARLPPRVVAHV